MKAQPMKFDGVRTYNRCEANEATHVNIIMPGPSGFICLPVQIKGTREGTGNWTWNGDTENPTLKPSILTKGYDDRQEPSKMFVCHSWVSDGKAQFLGDSTHEFAGQTIDLLEVDG